MNSELIFVTTSNKPDQAIAAVAVSCFFFMWCKALEAKWLCLEYPTNRVSPP